MGKNKIMQRKIKQSGSFCECLNDCDQRSLVNNPLQPDVIAKIPSASQIRRHLLHSWPSINNQTFNQNIKQTFYRTLIALGPDHAIRANMKVVPISDCP